MKFTAILGRALLILGILLCGFGLWVMFGPARYRASAVVEVQHKSALGGYDPWFIQTEFELIQSDLILSNAIKRPNLAAKADVKKAGVGEALLLLRKRLILRAFGQDILEISVVDKSPKEAARIANAIAETYLAYQTEQKLKRLEYAAKSKTSTGGDDAVSGGETARLVAAALPPKAAMGPSQLLGVGSLLCGLATSVAGCALIFKQTSPFLGAPPVSPNRR